MKYIDIENSYTYFNMNNSLSKNEVSSNIWRSSIVSTLSDLSINKKYYLNKECVSEAIGKNPFLRQWGYLFQTITADDKTVTSFRTSANNQSRGNFRFQNKNHRTFIEANENIITNKINYCMYEEKSLIGLSAELNNLSDNSVYCLINYEIDQKKFDLFFRSDYTNFSSNKIFLQPIFGLCPFLHKEKLSLAYVSKNIGTDMTGDLEFFFGDYTPFFNSFKSESKNFIKFYIKKFLNKILPFTYDYDNYINIKTSSIKFYKKII